MEPREIRETDVIVVGSGIAGSTAALTASDNGVDVTILEKAARDDFGGNSALSGGGLNVQSPDAYYRTLMEYSSGEANEDLVRTVAENGRRSAQWLRDQGVELEWNDDAKVAHAADRGKSIMDALERRISAEPIEVLFQAQATELLTDDRDRVRSVRVTTREGDIEYHATRGIVLATGSFQANEDMVAEFIGEDATDIVPRGQAHVTGGGHQMALDIGANVVEMEGIHGSPIHPDSGANFVGWYPYGLLVNVKGERFIDEGDATYVEVGKAIYNQPERLAFGILDDRWRNLVPDSRKEYFLERGGELTTAKTVGTLAEKLGIDPTALKRTVKQYNEARDVTIESADDQSEVNTMLPLDSPPFYGTPLVNGAALTLGGLEINDEAEVLRRNGTPIGRLYAAGEVAGGLYHEFYPGGTSLSAGVTFGRIAGENVASESPIRQD